MKLSVVRSYLGYLRTPRDYAVSGYDYDGYFLCSCVIFE